MTRTDKNAVFTEVCKQLNTRADLAKSFFYREPLLKRVCSKSALEFEKFFKFLNR
jgi:hypothetical protein